MVRVKIVEIKSTRDPASRLEGKQVVFAEVREKPKVQILGETEEARIVDSLVQQLRRMGLPMRTRAELRIPKMVLFLTEGESEEIGIPLEVNKTYELAFREGKIELKGVEAL